MPRKARKLTNSKIHHTIVQGIDKEFIFNEEKMMEKYKKLICEKLQNSNVTILAYCIMNNHTHFLMYSENIENISKFMHKLNTAYSHYYNKEKNRVGYVFRNRYYSQQILNQGQLYRCLRYIHNNPVKANIVNKMEEYKYSSYNEFFENKEIITDDSIKRIFGIDSDAKKIFDFIHSEKMKDVFGDEKEDIKEFIKRIEKMYNIEARRIRKNKELLKTVIKQVKEMTNATNSQIANILEISNSTVANYLKK